MTYLEYAREPISPFNQIIIFRLGAGVTNVGDEDTAFSHRDADYLFHPICVWEDPAEDEREMTFGRDFARAMKPFSTGGAAQGQVRPSNLFQHNQTIAPSGLARA